MSRQPADQPYHIILAGSPNVGKTSAFSWLSGNAELDGNLELTAMSEDVPLILPTARRGPAIVNESWKHSMKLSSEIVEVVLWDTGNMERGLGGVSKITRSYFRYAVGVILMYDSGRRDTLIDLVAWVESCRKNSVWRSCDTHVTFVLWSNERSSGNTDVSPSDLTFLKKTCEFDGDHCAVDTASGENITEQYCTLVASVHNKVTSIAVDATSHHIVAPLGDNRQSPSSCC